MSKGNKDAEALPQLQEDTQDDIVQRKQAKQQYISKPKQTFTEEQQKFIDEKLSSKFWRLNNLYTIYDKDGNKGILTLNDAQTKVVKQFKHNRKIILKSRQQGISTLYVAYYLDSCLFTPGFQAGIQSYGQSEADKLAKRALVMWDNLDDNVKAILEIKMLTNNQKGMSFSNGSILKIGNFRGDTLQGLHVSELGKIAKFFPARAKEIKTGAFQAIGKNNKITIESTAEGNSGMFYDMWHAAVLAKAKGKLSPLSFEPIFLSWVIDPDCNLDHQYEAEKELDAYFSKIEKHLDITLTETQKSWYQDKSQELGEDMKQEYPTYPEEAFEQSVEGTIFRNEYQRIVKEERYHPITINYKLDTYVAYDIGVNDETVLTFTQLIQGRPTVVMTYSNTRENLEFYVGIMKSTGFNIKMVYLPHDANVQEFISGRTRIEEFRRLGVPCRLLPRLTTKEYINALRTFLAVVVINSDKAEDTMKSIQMYRWRFDKSLNVYLQTPLHDENSNYIDSLKYMAIGIHYNKTLGAYERAEEEIIIDRWDLIDRKSNRPHGYSV